MTNLETRIKRELEHRFETTEDIDVTITITMKKSKDKLVIKNITHPETDFFDVRIYLSDNNHNEQPVMTWIEGYDKLTMFVSDYDQKRQEIIDKIDHLRNFKKMHLDGHNAHELHDGTTFALRLAEMADGTDETVEILKHSEQARKLYESLGYSTDKALQAIELSKNADTYSDMYKSLYSVRPKLY